MHSKKHEWNLFNHDIKGINTNIIYIFIHRSLSLSRRLLSLNVSRHEPEQSTRKFLPIIRKLFPGLLVPLHTTLPLFEVELYVCNPINISEASRNSSITVVRFSIGLSILHDNNMGDWLDSFRTQLQF